MAEKRSGGAAARLTDDQRQKLERERDRAIDLLVTLDRRGTMSRGVRAKLADIVFCLNERLVQDMRAGERLRLRRRSA